MKILIHQAKWPTDMKTLALLLLFLSFSSTAENNANEYVVTVDGIACPFCAYGIEKQLNKLSGILEMNTDIAAGVIRLTVEDTVTLREEDVRTAVEKAGFSMRGFSARVPE